MSVSHRIRVWPLPSWLDVGRLLGAGDWRFEPFPEGGIAASCELPGSAAADLCARLRAVGLGGTTLQVEVTPPLSRAQVRAGRAAEARRMRDRSVGFSRAGTRCDDEARWSLTPEQLALQLGQRARGMSVLDAGCGAGGNAIGFARAGCRVTAVEADAQRVLQAEHNAAVYGVADRIEFVRGDAVELAAHCDADLLFVDPPWGRDYDKRRTELGDLPLLAALLPERARFREFWAKVPPSFDPTTTCGARPEACFGSGLGDERRVKFLLLRL